MNNKPNLGTLYLIPTHLALPINANAILPRDVISTALQLNHYIAENAKTARAFLKAIGMTRPLQEISIQELNKHSDANPNLTSAAASQTATLNALLAPLLAGHDVGLVTEERHGRERLYHFVPERLGEVRDWMAQYERFWDTRLLQLKKLLSKKDKK